MERSDNRNNAMATDTTELLKRVRRIELKSRGLSNQIFSGEYHSAFKGRGMAFSEVREYIPGDEIRTIDWNVTARFGHPYVKIFEEERELTVMLVIDISASDSFGTDEQLKKQLITEVSAVIAFSAIQNNDKIGVIFFSSKVEKFIPPKKGKAHILRIIRELLEIEPQEKTTDLGEGLRYLNNVIKKRSIVFILSDFLCSGFEKNLKHANKKHDVIGLRVTDEREGILPNVGLVEFEDPETGETRWIDTSSKKVRKFYEAEARTRRQELSSLFSRSGIDWTTLYTGQSYVKPLMNLFESRG